MAIEFTRDYGEEIIRELKEVFGGIDKLKRRLGEKDKNILELEEKLIHFKQLLKSMLLSML